MPDEISDEHQDIICQIKCEITDIIYVRQIRMPERMPEYISDIMSVGEVICGYKVVPQFVSKVAANNSNFTAVYGLQVIYIYLVGGFNPSEKYEFVSWDDYSQYMEKQD